MLIIRSLKCAIEQCVLISCFLENKTLDCTANRKPQCQAMTKIVSEIKLKATCVQLREIMEKIHPPGEASVDIVDTAFQV